ncbi:MAG: hypothetical protein JWR26_64 [Pedosphaera sp.]|nr:hypothetical protein [Pedosphaera sp.]
MNQIYSPPEDHLSQGDIFDLGILGITASCDNHILRNASFHPLLDPNAMVSDAKYHRFSSLTTAISPVETILSSVIHIRRFIVVSQTCDVCGVDSPQATKCTVARVVTLAEFMRDFKLPIPASEGLASTINILDFIEDKVDAAFRTELQMNRNDDFRLPDSLRKAIISWTPKGDTQDGKIKHNLRVFLNKITQGQSGKAYYLKKDDTCRMPESFVDFFELHLVHTEEIANKKSMRLASLVSPVKEEFSSKLGQLFSRVALAEPSKGAPF